jgi:hypothetical protein
MNSPRQVIVFSVRSNWPHSVADTLTLSIGRPAGRVVNDQTGLSSCSFEVWLRAVTVQ